MTTVNPFFELATMMTRRKPCPECGGVMMLTDGEIGKHYAPAYNSTREIPMRLVSATFWACSACEHCEEMR